MTQLSDFTRFAIQMARECPDVPPHILTTFCGELIRYAGAIHRLNEVHCNRGLSDNEVRRLEKLHAKVKRSTTELKLGVEINGDPRGASVKLALPSGTSNSFGDRLYPRWTPHPKPRPSRSPTSPRSPPPWRRPPTWSRPSLSG